VPRQTATALQAMKRRQFSIWLKKIFLDLVYRICPRGNLSTWDFVWPCLGKLELFAGGEQSFQYRALTYNTHQLMAIAPVDFDCSLIADAGGAAQPEAMAANVVQVMVVGFVLNNRKLCGQHSDFRPADDFLA
jgi:hypothetical protein